MYVMYLLLCIMLVTFWDSLLDNPIVKKLVWLGIATVLIGGFAAEHAMAVLVNFLGLLNVGGFIIITLIVYFTASKKHAGEYANSWGLNLLGLILILAGAYAVSTYIAMFF